MPKQTIGNAKLWIDQFDASGDMNAVALSQTVAALDQTTIGDQQRTYVGGLRAFTASLQGLWETGTNKNDEILSARLGSATGVLVTLDPTPNGGAEGDRAYCGIVNLASYQPGGTVGEMAKFSVALEALGGLAAGTLMHNATRSAGGTGTIQPVPAIATGRSLLAGLHVLAISGGGTLTVTVQSAALVGFGSPTTRGTFTGALAPGAQSLVVAGPITDQFYRITWALTGTVPSCQFVVALGPA